MIFLKMLPATREEWLRQYAAGQEEKRWWATLSFRQKVVEIWKALR